MSSINKIKILVLSCGHLFSRSETTSESVIEEMHGKRTMLCPICNKMKTIEREAGGEDSTE